ncbi:MAG TPA: hypothetical protein VGS19_21645 [Streptosporangiaceae bacterium]|nr:hypothetical protein [Streptosporangiaceae bacterium]
MSTGLDQRGWTAAQLLSVLCHQPAIMQSRRGKPCHWTWAMAWTNEREDQDHAEAPRGKYAACRGGGLVPAPGCSCNGTAHTCLPVVCTVCKGTGLARPSCH